MKRARIKSIFAGYEELLKIKNDLDRDFADCNFKPQDVPVAVMQLEKTHQKILQHAWRALKNDHLNSSRQDALRVFNQFFNLEEIDEDKIKQLLDDVSEIHDLDEYLAFREERKRYAQAVKDYLVSLYTEMKKIKFQENGRYHEEVRVMYIEKYTYRLKLKWRIETHFGWHASTPKDIQKIQTMLNNAVPAKDVYRSDEFYLKKFADIADFFLGMSLPAGKEVHRDTQAFYDRQVKQINALEFVALQQKVAECRLG